MPVLVVGWGGGHWGNDRECKGCQRSVRGLAVGVGCQMGIGELHRKYEDGPRQSTLENSRHSIVDNRT